MRRRQHTVKGSVVAVTGGARGIGRAIAGAFAAEGARVAIGDLAAAPLEEAASAAGGETIGLPLDVTSPSSFGAFLDGVEERFGPLDVLVNNAGVFSAGRLHEEPDAVTARLVAVNFAGTLTGTKLAVARMLPRGRGHIVNVASIGAVIPTANAVTYSATKGAVLAASRALRWELCDTGIRVTAVLPGTIRTEMTAQLPAPPRPSPQPVEPEVVGQAVVRAVSRAAPEVYVPSSLGAGARALGVLSPRLADRLKRASGFHRMVAQRDDAAERRYRERVEREQGPSA